MRHGKVNKRSVCFWRLHTNECAFCFGLDRCVIVITGGSSGIGQQVALRYAERNCRYACVTPILPAQWLRTIVRLVLAARNMKALNKVKTECIAVRRRGSYQRSYASVTQLTAMIADDGVTACDTSAVAGIASSASDILLIQTDVTQQEACEHLINKTVEVFKQIDYLVLP